MGSERRMKENFYVEATLKSTVKVLLYNIYEEDVDNEYWQYLEEVLPENFEIDYSDIEYVESLDE